MSKLFNSSNPFWQGMERLFDMVVLNCLWLLCCIPIFTIGASTTAFHYAAYHVVKGDGGYVSHDFFHSFKQNFKQGTLMGLGFLALFLFLIIDILMCYHSGRGIYTFFMVFFAVIFLITLFTALYAFPLLANFQRTIREILIWAFTLSLKHIGRTLLMTIALVVGLWSCRLLSGLIFISFGIVVELHAALLLPVLNPYFPKEDISDYLTEEEIDTPIDL